MAAGEGYFATGYWNANYWSSDYWNEGGTETGDYWNNNYWNVNYWNVNYWLEFNDGDVTQRNAAQLTLTPLTQSVNVGLNAQPDTEALPLVTFQADANLDIDPAVTTASLTLTGYNPSIGLEGYQLGDIDLRWYPDSAITITYGVVTDLETLTLGPMTHTVGFEGGVNVGASVASLTLTPYVTDARLDISVEPLPESLTLTGFNTTAGIGTQVPATLAALSYGLPTHTVEGTPGQADAFPLPVFLTIAGNDPQVVGFPTAVKPEDTFGDYGALITNADATSDVPSNYVICDRSGFRVKPGELMKDGYGWMVRSRSWEPKHPQDFVRARAEKLEGSKRPEQADRFIGVDEPEVTAADL